MRRIPARLIQKDATNRRTDAIGRLLPPVLAVLLLISFSATVAHGLDLAGYYENTLQGQMVDVEGYVFDRNKLRLDLMQDYSKGVLRGDVIFQIYSGRKKYDLVDFFPEDLLERKLSQIDSLLGDFNAVYQRIRSLDPDFDLGLPVPDAAYLKDEFTSGFTYEFEDKIYLDNLYARIEAWRLTFTVGKQQMPWGTGYTWNPTDIFNRKDVFDPTYEKEGVVGLQLALSPAPMFELKGVAALPGLSESYPGDFEETDAAFGVRFKGRAGRFDISASYLQIPEYVLDLDDMLDQAQQGLHSLLLLTDAQFSAALPEIEAGLLESASALDITSAQAERNIRNLVGADFVGEIEGVGLWAEGAYNRYQNGEEQWWEVVAGTEYTFDFETHVMAEYFYNGRGQNDRDDYTLTDWLRLFSQDLRGLGQHYAFAGFDHPATDLSTLGVFGIFNFTDYSGAAYAVYRYDVFSDAELEVLAAYSDGPDNSEYSLGPGSAYLRLTMYF